MDKVFPNGIIFAYPKEGAPEFVIGKISIKKSELIPFLNSQNGDWVNLDVKLSKKNTIYCDLNTWKPNKNEVAEKGYKTINKTPEPPEDNSELPF